MKTLLLLSLLAASEAQSAPRQLERLAKAPKIDGRLEDWSRPRDANARASVTNSRTHNPDPNVTFTSDVAWHGDTLYVGVSVDDRHPHAGDEAEVSLFFPDAGPLAPGFQFRVGADGLRQAAETPRFAQERVRAAGRRVPTTTSGRENQLVLELAVPARALPRFPATGPLTLDVCVNALDQDASATPPTRVGTCPGGPQGMTRVVLPPAFRTALGLRPPKAVTALEPAATGWLGYSDAPHPVWVQADSPLTRDSLQTLFAPDLAPQSAALKAPLPPWVTLSDGRRVLLVLSGRSPFREEGACSPGTEARLGLFLVDKSGRAATRVLDWSAANCELGRVLSVALDDENALEVGYSGGAQVRFVWVGDHFERTDIG